jgi:acyl-CoA thioesterase I
MTVRYVVIGIGIVIIGLVILRFFSNPEWEITNAPVSGQEIIAFGDSLVVGVGSTPGNNFVSVTSRIVGVPIKNLGRAGDTSQSAIGRIDTVLQTNPDIVIILLGGNDAIQRFSVEDTERNLFTIIQRVQSVGAITMLLGVRGGLLGNPYNKMYKRVAKSTGSVYISDVLSGLFGNPQYMSDTIHPNDAGYAKIAERVAEKLNRLINQTK